MNSKLKVDTNLTVETPEGVDFEFQLAGPGKRGFALLIDLGVKLIIVLITARLLGLFGAVTGTSSGMLTGVMLLTVFAVNWLYSALFESFFNGQTPGKMLMRLRVVRTNGTPISFYEAIGRNLLLAADFLPIAYTAGMLMMMCTRRQQRLGDLIFDTMVVDETSDSIITQLEFHGVTQALQRSECGGRFDVPERTLAVIERLFEKNRYIPFERRENIAELLTGTLKKRLGYERHRPVASGIQWNDPGPYGNTEFLHQVLITFADHPDLKQFQEAPDQISPAIDEQVEELPTARVIQWIDERPATSQPTNESAEINDSEGEPGR